MLDVQKRIEILLLDSQWPPNHRYGLNTNFLHLDRFILSEKSKLFYCIPNAALIGKPIESHAGWLERSIMQLMKPIVGLKMQIVTKLPLLYCWIGSLPWSRTFHALVGERQLSSKQSIKFSHHEEQPGEKWKQNLKKSDFKDFSRSVRLLLYKSDNVWQTLFVLRVFKITWAVYLLRGNN